MSTLRRGVYAITDPRLLPDDKPLLEAVEQALRGGLALLQYRDKQASRTQRLRRALALTQLCHKYRTPLLINDDVETCLRVGADGVHLGQSDTSLAEARRLLPDNAIIGISCHARADLAREAQEKGADYVAMGRFFPSRTKPDAPRANVADLRTVREQLAIPLVAIGGVNAENGGQLVAAGADMLAAIDYLFSGPDVQVRTRALNRLFHQEVPHD